MTVLVTGGAGYIGSHMVLELLDAGEWVIVLDNLSTGLQRAVPDGVPLIVGDTGDLLRVRFEFSFGEQHKHDIRRAAAHRAIARLPKSS